MTKKEAGMRGIVIPQRRMRRMVNKHCAMALREDTYKKLESLKRQTGHSMTAIMAMLVDAAVAGK